MGILFVIHITLGIVFLVIFLTSRAKSETKTKTEEKRENPPVTNAEIVVAPFEKLSAKQFHDICSLRNEVFVVEQNCVYQDLDGFDEGAMHVCLYENGVLAAYCRVLDKNTKHAEVSIGRVVSRTRKKGHGAMVMKRAIEVARTVFDAAKIEVSAQCYAIPFYARFGFVACSEVYLEDGIEHKLLRLDF